MTAFVTRTLAPRPDGVAPDGSEVTLLAATGDASMAQFVLRPGQVSRAVGHRTVAELWFVTAGRGRMWRAGDGGEAVTDLAPGTSLSVPLGTRFQFRNDGDDDLRIVGVTMPPWPGDGEAFAVAGKWPASLRERRPDDRGRSGEDG